MKNGFDEVVVFGDVHLPFHDLNAVRLALKVASVVKPKYCVQVGDMLDGYHLSRFDHDPNMKHVTLAEEARYGREFIAAVRKRCEQAFFLEGNHEARLHKSLAKAPELHSTHPTMRELLGLKVKEWVPYRERLTLGKCNFVHDEGPCGVNALRQTIEAARKNLVFGHTHTLGTLYDGVENERHGALNVGWLGNPKHATYATRRQRDRWQHGIGYVQIERGTGNCFLHALPFVNGQCVVPNHGVVAL